MKTGFVWHERYAWHNTGRGAGPYHADASAWNEPDVRHSENADGKRRFRNLLDVTGLLDQLVVLTPRPATVEEVCEPFLVRAGNPKNIKDWADLVKGDVSIITPNPKTSGNGKYSFLAAWGATLAAGGSEGDAKTFVTEVYKRTPVLDTGARAATATFSQKGIGDVHLTFENEAHLEVAEAGGELEIIYPTRSIRVDPPVAVVDENVDRKATRHVAEAYLGFLYTPEGRTIIAKHHYRPWGENPPTPAGGKPWPAIETFDIGTIGGWEVAMKKFFGEGGVFDAIYQPVGR